MNIPQIIITSEKRTEALLSQYDPLMGSGSPIERFQFKIKGLSDTSLFLPMAMKENPLLQKLQKSGSVQKVSNEIEETVQEVINAFDAVRCIYDFEFWAARCVRIKTKKRPDERFILNFPQRILLKEFERQRLSNKPIRVILLKHRQWGGSTLTQLYIAWIQMFLRIGAAALIVSNMKDQSKHIMQMYLKMLRSHPPEILNYLYKYSSMTLTPYAGSSNFKMIKEREALLGVGSVQEPEALRSHTVHLLHMSEVGSWKSNTSVNASDLAQTLYGALVDEPLTFCVKESTAQGVGNYFHKEWQRAERKESNDIPVFIEWFMDLQYRIDPLTLEGISSREQFVGTWTTDEYALFELGATIEHIAWKRYQIKNYAETWRFQQEYPSTPDEAFTNTANRVFPQEYVKKIRKLCTPPLAIGELEANSRKGKESLVNIKFAEQVNGSLSIWKYPHKNGMEREGMIYYNRYCAFADVGGRSAKSDYSVITILDRFPVCLGNHPEVVAEFHGHMDQDLFAWYAARLCTWYGKANLGIEINSLKYDQGDDERGFTGDHSYTILDEISDCYNNFYVRDDPQNLAPRWSNRIGFHTNRKTKPMIIDALFAAIRDGEYLENNVLACDELDTYMQFPDGRTGAISGYHDDRVISRAGAIWLSTQMDPVRKIDPNERRSTARRGHFATFN
jgi:hypothetical protein